MKHSWPHVGAFLGGVTTTTANVAGSWVPPKRAPSDWSPHPGSVISALFWPLALFVASEIMARTQWPPGKRWVAVRYAGLLPVAAVAAYVSYQHLSKLLTYYGESEFTTRAGPLAIDGLMVISTAALVAESHVQRAVAATELASSVLSTDTPDETGDTASPDAPETPPADVPDRRPVDPHVEVDVPADVHSTDAPSDGGSTSSLLQSVTRRQHGVNLVKQGRNVEDVASELKVSVRTVKHWVTEDRKQSNGSTRHISQA